MAQHYRSTPPDEPVTKGFYRISRNPQALTLLVSFYGVSIAVGSWLALFILTASLVFHHLTVLAEEGSCLRQYGDSYSAYMKRVPRYFLFF
jgi:protein-S-isoprenylcysteine O-methyltransferase Ste14